MNSRTISAAWLRGARGENNLIPITREEAAVLADALDEADDSFRSLIECSCSSTGVGPERLYDVSLNNLETYELPSIERAARYLESRGLLERKEGDPGLVRLVGAA